MKPHAKSQTIYIIEGDPDVSFSTKCLLESRNKPVKIVSNSDEFLALHKVENTDTVLLDLDPKKPLIFRLLNRLMFAQKPPNVIVTCPKNSTIKPDDIFAGKHIKVLFHPIFPHELLKAIDYAS